MLDVGCWGLDVVVNGCCLLGVGWCVGLFKCIRGLLLVCGGLGFVYLLVESTSLFCMLFQMHVGKAIIICFFFPSKILGLSNSLGLDYFICV